MMILDFPRWQSHLFCLNDMEFYIYMRTVFEMNIQHHPPNHGMLSENLANDHGLYLLTP